LRGWLARFRGASAIAPAMTIRETREVAEGLELMRSAGSWKEGRRRGIQYLLQLGQGRVTGS
jgi:hypothetical protein